MPTNDTPFEKMLSERGLQKNYVMKVGLLVIFSLCICVVFGNAQENQLVPIQINQKWGFTDNNLNIVIPAQYDSASLFTSNVAIVKEGKLYGVVNKKGDIILKSQYPKIILSHGGQLLIVYKKNGKEIFFDNSGNKLKTSPASLSHCGHDLLYTSTFQIQKHSIMQEGKYALVYLNPYLIEGLRSMNYDTDTTDFIYDSIVSFYHDSFVVEKNSKVGIWIPSELYTKIDFKYDEILINPSTSKSSLHGTRKDDKWGFIDYLGRQIVPCIYYSINLNPKLIWEKFILVEYEKNMFGYIDLAGKEYFTRRTN